MINDSPTFSVVGDRGLLVRFGEGIDRKTNQRVQRLTSALSAASISGIIEIIPAYNTVLVNYEPALISVGMCKEYALNVDLYAETDEPATLSIVEIPVIYGDEFGPDLEFVAIHNGISSDEVIRIHSSADYTVYMLGFTPGFAYLGGMSEKIAAPRLDMPRDRVEAGSVGIANLQTGIYPIASAGGWRIIGRTPSRLFRPTEQEPFLYTVGDTIRFRPVSGKEYASLVADQ